MPRLFGVRKVAEIIPSPLVDVTDDCGAAAFHHFSNDWQTVGAEDAGTYVLLVVSHSLVNISERVVCDRLLSYALPVIPLPHGFVVVAASACAGYPADLALERDLHGLLQHLY